MIWISVICFSLLNQEWFLLMLNSFVMDLTTQRLILVIPKPYKQLYSLSSQHKTTLKYLKDFNLVFP